MFWVAVIVVVFLKERGTLSKMFCVGEERKRRDFAGYFWGSLLNVSCEVVFVASEWLMMTVVWCFRVVVKRMRTLRDLGCWLLGF